MTKFLLRVSRFIGLLLSRLAHLEPLMETSGDFLSAVQNCYHINMFPWNHTGSKVCTTFLRTRLWRSWFLTIRLAKKMSPSILATQPSHSNIRHLKGLSVFCILKFVIFFFEIENSWREKQNTGCTYEVKKGA